MALEEKRSLDQILVRVNSPTNDFKDGISISYRSWVEKDGQVLPNTVSMEPPTPADWQSEEVITRIGRQAAVAHGENMTLRERNAELEGSVQGLEKENADLRSRVEELELNVALLESEAPDE